MKKKRIIVAFFMILLCTMAIGMSAFAEETTLKNKKWVTGQGAYFVDTDNDGVADKWQDNGDIYYKINVPKTGIIKVQVKVSDAPGAEEYYGYDPGDSYDENKITFVDLLDAQKETYNNSFWDSQDYKSSDLMIEPVKKGIYYLKVHGDEKYQICYTFKAVGKLSKAGTSGSNAVKLVAGKTVKRFLSQNSKKKDFYKINLTEDKKITVTYNVTNRALFRVCKKKGKKYVQVDKNIKGYILEQKGKININLKKGTYYFQLYSGSTDSAYYTLKWQ